MRDFEIILRTINSQRSLTDLVKVGMLPHQIAKVLDGVLRAGFVFTTEDDLLLVSSAGYDFLSQVAKKSGRIDGRWIEPAYQHRRQAMRVSEVYVPKQDVVSSLRGK